VVPLRSNDLWQFNSVFPMGKKAVRRAKKKKDHVEHPDEKKTEFPEQDKKDFGGMNLDNFKKNLGCGG
jgi:hypothetical protein